MERGLLRGVICSSIHILEVAQLISMEETDCSAEEDCVINSDSPTQHPLPVAVPPMSVTSIDADRSLSSGPEPADHTPVSVGVRLRREANRSDIDAGADAPTVKK